MENLSGVRLADIQAIGGGPVHEANLPAVPDLPVLHAFRRIFLVGLLIAGLSFILNEYIGGIEVSDPRPLPIYCIRQLIALVLKEGDFEFYLTIAALPLSMLLIYEGHLAARHESRWMMGVFGFGCLAAMIYFVYKVRPVRVRFRSNPLTASMCLQLFRIWSHRSDSTYHDVYKTLTVFGRSCLVTCSDNHLIEPFSSVHIGGSVGSH